MQKRDELIFWFDQPPKVSKGAYNHVSEAWGNKVLYIADHPFGEHRKMIKWDDDDYGGAEMIILSQMDNEAEYIRRIFEKYPNAVHILNGFVSIIEKKIRKYIKNADARLAVTTEKPFVSGNGLTVKQSAKNFLLPFKYKNIYRKYSPFVDVLIPLGATGKRLFESYGWEPEKTFSYMYCPVLQDVGERPGINVSDPVKFLYVGRFNFVPKGLDVIMEALNPLEGQNWHLDIVGGYGDNKDEVIAWAENHQNVSFLGSWPSNEVGRRMKEYDVYLLATKADGWNAQINEALHAGIGVITTDEAVSDELVSSSGAGMVVKSADVKAFRRAVKNVVDNPKIAMEWKQKAVEYEYRISGKVVGDYFIDILDYTFYDRAKRPKCPWLNE